MLESSWSIRLPQQPQMFTLGTLPESAILYQSNSQNLMIYSKNQSSSLPIRKDLLGIATLPILNSNQNQGTQLLLLTKYNLSCLDLLNNNEVFGLQFENADKLFLDKETIYVVCGSDLYCYSHFGEEISVIHLPAIIQCVIGLPKKHSDHKSPENSFIVAMKDQTLTQYTGVNIFYDYGKVIGIICCMDWMGTGVMVGSTEGTVAFYETKKSKWKAKSSHKPIAIKQFISDEKSMAIVGRQNGLVQLRDWSNGGTFGKVKLGETLIGIQLFDYRSQGFEQLLCVCKSGDVKAYNIVDDQTVHPKGKALPAQIKAQEEDIEKLANIKAELQYEIEQMKNQLKEEGTNDGPILSPQFTLTAMLLYDNGLVLRIICAHGYISGLSFQEPILPVMCQKLTLLSYKFSNENKTAGQLNCEALVHSNFNSKVFQIRKFNVMLPRFWKWGLIAEKKRQIQSFTRFRMNERNARYLKWLQQCFLLSITEPDLQKLEHSLVLKLRFLNSYENLELELIFSPKEGKVQIYCDSLKTLGDIVQDLVEYIGIKDLDSELIFPYQKDQVKETLSIIERLSQTKVSISSEMAEAINTIKYLLVKGESARAVGNMKELRKSYREVMEQNRNLMIEITKKNQNTKNLSDSMKKLGQWISNTSNVRYGESKAKIVVHCREAIKNKDFVKIIRIMEGGADVV